MCEPYLDHDLKKPIVKTQFQDNEGILNINQVLDAIELLGFFLDTIILLLIWL